MDFDRLAEFTVIARLGSIKKAAQELGVSCATLSARLIQFEKHLGEPLFERTGSAMVLTQAGQQLLPSALEILSRYHRLRGELCAAQEHSYHQLRIAVSGSNLPLNLGPFLDQLNLNNPNIRLEILDDTHFGIADGLQSGAVDIYFAPVMEDFAPKGLSRNTVSPSTPFIVLPRSHRLADRAMVSIRELDREQFILYPPTAESAIRDFQLRNLRDSGIHYTLYAGNTSTLFYKLLVPVGKGLLLRPTPMMDVPPNAVCLPVTDLPHPATMCFFYDKTNPRADVQAFVKDFPHFAKEVSQREHSPAL
ncbi:MAG: LysR family transcriptional regulator [Oscillospiraceae bacterium]